MDQNHPTSRNVIVKNCDIPTNKLTIKVTNFRPSFILIRGWPIQRAAMPQIIVPKIQFVYFQE